MTATALHFTASAATDPEQIYAAELEKVAEGLHLVDESSWQDHYGG